jgi:predicted transcriptional regulator
MRTRVDLADSQVQKLDELSRHERRSRAALIREAIDDFLARRLTKDSSDAFGLWGERRVDSLAYQAWIRREW